MESRGDRLRFRGAPRAPSRTSRCSGSRPTSWAVSSSSTAGDGISTPTRSGIRSRRTSTQGASRSNDCKIMGLTSQSGWRGSPSRSPGGSSCTAGRSHLRRRLSPGRSRLSADGSGLSRRWRTWGSSSGDYSGSVASVRSRPRPGCVEPPTMAAVTLASPLRSTGGARLHAARTRGRPRVVAVWSGGLPCWIAPARHRARRELVERARRGLEAAPALVLVFSAATDDSRTSPGSWSGRPPAYPDRPRPPRTGRTLVRPALLLRDLAWLDTGGVGAEQWESPLVRAVRRAVDSQRTPRTRQITAIRGRDPTDPTRLDDGASLGGRRSRARPRRHRRRRAADACERRGSRGRARGARRHGRVSRPDRRLRAGGAGGRGKERGATCAGRRPVVRSHAGRTTTTVGLLHRLHGPRLDGLVLHGADVGSQWTSTSPADAPIPTAGRRPTRTFRSRSRSRRPRHTHGVIGITGSPGGTADRPCCQVALLRCVPRWKRIADPPPPSHYVRQVLVSGRASTAGGAVGGGVAVGALGARSRRAAPLRAAEGRLASPTGTDRRLTLLQQCAARRLHPVRHSRLDLRDPRTRTTCGAVAPGLRITSVTRPAPSTSPEMVRRRLRPRARSPTSAGP